MKFARPGSGFIIKMTPGAQATLDGVADTIPRIGDVWAGICERLKFTAHREGQDLPNGGLIIQFPGDATYGIPTIAVCFDLRADTVLVRRILVRV